MFSQNWFERKCEHRHKYFNKDGSFDHPYCFRNRQWYEYDNIKVCYFDIEVSDLKRDNGFMLSYAIKERNKNKIKFSYLNYYDRMGDWRDWDKNLIEECFQELSNYDLIIGYNSSVFDIPYLRASALENNLGFFQPKTKYQLDLYFALRGKISLSRKNLKNMTHFLGIEGKTSLGEYWRNFIYGDYSENTVNQLKEHNISDVVILEQLHKEYEPFIKFNRNYV